MQHMFIYTFAYMINTTIANISPLYHIHMRGYEVMYACIELLQN